MHESELVDRLKKGEESAYRRFVDTYQTSVLNCCYRVVADRQAAEDLTQEVFIEVHRSIRHFRSESKLSTWVYRIAMTKSLTSPHRLRQCVSWISIFRHWLSEVGGLPLVPVAGSPESCVV